MLGLDCRSCLPCSRLHPTSERCSHVSISLNSLTPHVRCAHTRYSVYLTCALLGGQGLPYRHRRRGRGARFGNESSDLSHRSAYLRALRNRFGKPVLSTQLCGRLPDCLNPFDPSFLAKPEPEKDGTRPGRCRAGTRDGNGLQLLANQDTVCQYFISCPCFVLTVLRTRLLACMTWRYVVGFGIRYVRSTRRS